MKNIQDYLHLYLGCEVKSLDGGTMLYKLCGINFDGTGKFKTFEGFAMYLSNWKLLLRKLSDMSEEEAQELTKMLILPVGAKYSHNAHKNNSGQWVVRYGNRVGEYWIIDGTVFNQFQTIYLLSKHFDLFGLIEAGLALDATKIQK